MEHIREYKDITDFPPQKCLQINNCGQRRDLKQDITILRPRGRKDYYFLYVQSGWIIMEYGQKNIHIEAGKCLYYPPNVRQLYSLPAEGNPVTYYVHFTGPAADEAMSLLPPHDNNVYNIIDQTLFESLFHRLLYAYNSHRIYSERKNPISYPGINGILLEIIDVMLRGNSPSEGKIPSEIMKTSAHIREHFQEDIDLEECASNAHLSMSRFTHLFTEKMGISPRKFILHLRIDTAKELLLYSTLNVNEIAENVGFAEPSYFSRLFHKYTGVSPSDYRKKGHGAASVSQPRQSDLF